MKTGLVMEGGALRGMFTMGVLDVLLENNIVFNGACGVSAGAVFGCNYKSKQIGRAVRYNKKYCSDPRYCGWRSWIKTGDFYNVAFDYEELPKRLDIFDTATYRENPMEFYVVATDVLTGKAAYKNLMTGDDYDVLWMRASASMPVFSRFVEIDGRYYTDGGISDSIPLKFFEEIGYERNVVITTQPEGFVKKPNKYMGLFKIIYRKYPRLIETMKNRHIMYNSQLRYINSAMKSGRALVIRPPEPLNIKAGERNPQEIERVYQLGRREGIMRLAEIEEFLSMQR